jgi:acyl dehydratase
VETTKKEGVLMSEKTTLTEEMKAKIGTILAPIVLEVEKGAVRRFAQAVADPNPLYADEEYARKTRYGGIVCPPGFFGLPAGEEVSAERILSILGRPFENVLNAGNESEFYRPVRPGDVLVSSTKLADIYEKKGGAGNLLFVVLETTYKNQADQVVAMMRYVFMFY